MLACLAALCSAGAFGGDAVRLDGPCKNLRRRRQGVSAPEIGGPGGVEASCTGGGWRQEARRVRASYGALLCSMHRSWRAAGNFQNAPDP